MGLGVGECDVGLLAPPPSTSSRSSSPTTPCQFRSPRKAKQIIAVKRHKTFSNGEERWNSTSNRSSRRTALNKSFSSGSTTSNNNNNNNNNKNHNNINNINNNNSSPIRVIKISTTSRDPSSKFQTLIPNSSSKRSRDSSDLFQLRRSEVKLERKKSVVTSSMTSSCSTATNEEYTWSRSRDITNTNDNDPGRVQVFVRLRPPNESEQLSNYPIALSIPDQERTQLKLFDGKTDRCYQYDGIFPDTSTNAEVFKTVGQPLVYSALSGFNGILMCYGQTGTGKTYTLMSNDGMSVRIVYQCFKVLNTDKRHKYTVTCSYLQIYQEKIYDLLNETTTIELALREHPKTGVYIENLTEYVVHSPKEVLDLLKVGKSRLVFAETQMNRASSRSHAICQLKFLKERIGNDSGNVESSTPLYTIHTPDIQDHTPTHHDDDDFFEMQTERDTEGYQRLEEEEDDEDDEDIMCNVPQLEDGVTSVRGKLYICDLAGSERIKKTKACGERLQEAQHINSSLLELGNVIQALAEGKRSHVPFRNSTLTRLLQEGLSGNCKTRLVVCVAPTEKDVHETKCSLNFGSRAMKIQVMAHVNYEVDYKKLAEALAAKLETLEQDWNAQREDYDRTIKQLKMEVDATPCVSPMGNFLYGLKGPSRNVQSLLVVELMTLHLFYNVNKSMSKSATLTQPRVEIKQPNMAFQPCVDFLLPNMDLVLPCMEALLELLGDYLREGIPFTRKNNYSMSSGCSSVITSPDCIEPITTITTTTTTSSSTKYDVPPSLEPVARFLENAFLTTSSRDHDVTTCDDHGTGSDRIRKVFDSLSRLKEMVHSKALGALKTTFQHTNKEWTKELGSVEEIVNHLHSLSDRWGNKEKLEERIENVEDSLYYVLMDKSLLSCMLLLNSYGDGGGGGGGGGGGLRLGDGMGEWGKEMPRQSDLRSQEHLQLQQVRLQLKKVEQMKADIELKLSVLQQSNNSLEEEIAQCRQQKEELEEKIKELEKRKSEVEEALRNSENNNARKERCIVDLKNEKGVLEGFLTTLKQEMTMLEEERAQDTEGTKRLEEELEDVRDRNIVLETEWSCCREENGLMETELTALEEEKALVDAELVKYREDVKMIEEAVAMLEAQIHDYKKEILALKKKEERLMTTLRQEKEKFTKEMNSLKQEMSTLRVERRRYQRDISLSRTDKSNTERAYNALKAQKDAMQEDLAQFKQEEKRLQREITLHKSDRAKLEREACTLKNENTKLKQDLSQADKLKVELKLLQKNEEKIGGLFKIEKERLYESLVSFKERYDRMEADFSKVTQEKDKLSKQLKKHDESNGKTTTGIDGVVRRSQSQPTTTAGGGGKGTPEKGGKMKGCSSVQGALVRRSVVSGEVSHVEGQVLDLQRRLAFYMAEKEDLQKQLSATRDENTKLSTEVKTLESDVSNVQTVIAQLTDDKTSLTSKLEDLGALKDVLEKEKKDLEDAVVQTEERNDILRVELTEVSEQNHVLQVDIMTLKETAVMVEGESVVLKTENEHMKAHFQRMEKELRQTRDIVTEFNRKLEQLKAEVTEAKKKEIVLHDKVSFLENEKMSMNDELDLCQEEEELLIQQLAGLNDKFSSLENTVESLLQQKNSEKTEHAVQQMVEEVKRLKEENLCLEESVGELKLQLESVVLDAEEVNQQQEEVMKILQNDDHILKERQTGIQRTVSEQVRNLWVQLQKVKEEKVQLEGEMKNLEKQVCTLTLEKEKLTKTTQESLREEKEKESYETNIDKLQQQIEELIKERLHLESEMEFLKSQNTELRRGIAVLLEDNSKLESELDVVEEEFEKQEKELDSATEETKVLLRQLCAAETKNLTLSTYQSNAQEDLEKWKSEVGRIQKEKDEFVSKHEEQEKEHKCLQERFIVAQMEISKLKSEHLCVGKKAKLLSQHVCAVNRERNMKPVRECTDICKEVAKIKEELSSFNAHRTHLEMEQSDLQNRLKMAGFEKGELRNKLCSLIQDLDEEDSNTSNKENKDTAMIYSVNKLLKEKRTLEGEEAMLSDDISDCKQTNTILRTCVDTTTTELRTAQQHLCLATVDRLKLKDRCRNLEKSVENVRVSGVGVRCVTSQVTSQHNRKTTGISPLQNEVSKLKLDIEQFERSQTDILQEIRCLNEQLNEAENNLVNVVHFKTVIEKNLREYKERNTKLETHLRVIYNDLKEMESHMTHPPGGSDAHARESGAVLLETLDLHKHFQSLEDDLRNTQQRNNDLEMRNATLKEDANDLLERCASLQEEKQLNSVSSGYIKQSMDGQTSFIDEIQKEKASLTYENSRLKAKLALYKDDKKRILKDFQRLSAGLGAYAKYNRELERKLHSFKVDLSELQRSTGYDLTRHQSGGSTNSSVDHVTAITREHKSHLLCEGCREVVRQKFSGMENNTQLLGDELLDCISDNLCVQLAICHMLEQKDELEIELTALETEYDMESCLIKQLRTNGFVSYQNSSSSRKT